MSLLIISEPMMYNNDNNNGHFYSAGIRRKWRSWMALLYRRTTMYHCLKRCKKMKKLLIWILMKVFFVISYFFKWYYNLPCFLYKKLLKLDTSDLSQEVKPPVKYVLHKLVNKVVYNIWTTTTTTHMIHVLSSKDTTDYCSYCPRGQKSLVCRSRQLVLGVCDVTNQS